MNVNTLARIPSEGVGKGLPGLVWYLKKGDLTTAFKENKSIVRKPNLTFANPEHPKVI